jgi:prohibitin 2
MKAFRDGFKNAAERVASARAAAAKEGGGIPEGGGGAPTGGALASIILALGGLGLVGYGVSQSVVIVQPGRLGIVYNRVGGLNETATLTEGLNFVVPWWQRPVIYDTRVKSQVVNTSSGSKDLQMVQISLRVLFKPNPTQLSKVYRTLGHDFDARVLPSIVNEITKAVVAKYNASELLTKRDAVSAEVRSRLVKRASDFEIIVDDVSITHLAFSKDYTAAVEAKQVAQQDAERAKYIVDKALQEKKSIVIKADAEAKSAILIGKAMATNPAFVQLRRIEAAKEVAASVVASGNKVYLNSDSLMLNQLGDEVREKP